MLQSSIENSSASREKNI